MLQVSASPSTAQPVTLLHLPHSTTSTSRYADVLTRHGYELVTCASPVAAQDLIQLGSRAGLLVIEQENDIAELLRFESVLQDARVCWLGLIAKQMVAATGVRQFIAEHLFNYITLPADDAHIVLTLRHAWGMACVRASHASIQAENTDSALLGSSPQIEQLRVHIQKVAQADAPVLILGPAGSGKELAALELHRQSERASGPFVTVSCTSLTSDRSRDEVFGVGEGSQWQAAQGGTLFLDAAAELPDEAQVALLRLLNNSPVASCVPDARAGPASHAAPRIVCASQTSLLEAVQVGRFRQELYFRLNVMTISVPALHERSQDVEIIARHYFHRFARAHNRSLRGFSKAAMDTMLSHGWPGNVRELINRVQRATVVAASRFIQPEDLGLERQKHGELLSLEEARAAAERATIRRALAQSRNQISRAATLLGVSRVTLYRLIEKYNIRPETGAVRAQASLRPPGGPPEATA